eukprot:Phypoly_transcript_08811.p1 GENE.Phypoly_transcript_08811~~Phypoly_transcript_08811.p1  ORF type:complete len:426 (+),score=50.46 Phypoly_transcript_08811:196-1473(+)
MLKCIFYSEFDNIAGPRIFYQHPSGYLPNDLFDGCAEYIIPKASLCGRLISLVAFGKKILGYPVLIDDAKYHRNALLFNVCLVFDPDTDTQSYEPIVKKLSYLFRNLETEGEFLFNPARKAQLPDILVSIFTGLNDHAECAVPVDAINTIHLKLFPVMSDPPEVHEYHVPICISEVGDLTHWDLTMQQVVPFIDGVNYIGRIARLTGISLDLIQQCVQHLVFRGVVKLIDIFQYGNVYAPTPEMRVLADNPVMQAACLSYITIPGMQPPPFEKVFSIYAELHPAITFREFCQELDLPALNIDERAFITFGILNSFLRRIHKYPVKIPLMAEIAQNNNTTAESAPTTPNGTIPSLSPPSTPIMPVPEYDPKYEYANTSILATPKGNIHVNLDGSHRYDELCCMLGVSHEVLDFIVKTEQQVINICK